MLTDIEIPLNAGKRPGAALNAFDRRMAGKGPAGANDVDPWRQISRRVRADSRDRVTSETSNSAKGHLAVKAVNDGPAQKCQREGSAI